LADIGRNLADMEREGFITQTEDGYMVCGSTKKG
jgi:hypothetical protein